MLADLGFYLLFLCLIASCYGCLAAILAGFWRHRRLYRSARVAVFLNALLCLGGSLILWYLLFQRDYSVAYIFKNSSDDLPILYTITAFWSSLEGSHLLWTLLMSCFAALALWTHNSDNEHIMPHVTASLMGVLAWMFYLLLTHSDPFVRMLPAPPNGQGMNALLQNPYMAIHPPTLFIGYTGLAIPAAYSIAAISFGDVTEGWLKTVRRWTLFSWAALTAGIFLGGRWAYVELGWAGYWAWDPVENSSFIPWIFATAALHAMVVQDKLGHLKRLTLALLFLAFFFSFFGTFITRSGIVSSVHSFAESPIGPNYLFFLAGMLLIVVGLYAYKAQSILPSDNDKAWGVSKESALIITQFLLMTFAAIVCVGTLYPIVSEWVTGEKTNVQAPYFNAFAPWIGLGFIVAIAIGNIMRYQTADIPNLRRTLILSTIVALPLSAYLIWVGNVLATQNAFGLGAQVVGLYLCSWSIVCLTLDLYDRLRTLRFAYGLFFKRNLAYFGGYVAHIGLLVAIAGFLGNYRGVEKVVTLSAGESADLYGYELNFVGMEVDQKANATLFQAVLNLEKDGRELGQIKPARSQYPTKAELLHEIGVRSSFWHDIYITLADFNQESGDRATLEMHINPTVRLVWIAAIIMTIGGLIAMFDPYRGNKSRDTIQGLANS